MFERSGTHEFADPTGRESPDLGFRLKCSLTLELSLLWGKVYTHLSATSARRVRRLFAECGGGGCPNDTRIGGLYCGIG